MHGILKASACQLFSTKLWQVIRFHDCMTYDHISIPRVEEYPGGQSSQTPKPQRHINPLILPFYMSPGLPLILLVRSRT